MQDFLSLPCLEHCSSRSEAAPFLGGSSSTLGSSAAAICARCPRPTDVRATSGECETTCPFVFPLPSSWLMRRIWPCASTALIAAKTLPLPCVFPPPSWAVQEHVYNTTVPATCLPRTGFAGVWTPATPSCHPLRCAGVGADPAACARRPGLPFRRGVSP